MADGLNTFGTLETVELPVNGASPSTANDSVAKAPLGVLVRFQGNVYRYVKVDASDVAVAAYSAVYWETLDPTAGSFLVTADISDAIASGVNTVAGIVGNVAVTDKYFTWIQVGGIATALCAASAVAGDMALYGADGALGRLAAGQAVVNNIVGVYQSTRDITAGTAKVLLQNLDW